MDNGHTFLGGHFEIIRHSYGDFIHPNIRDSRGMNFIQQSVRDWGSGVLLITTELRTRN